jgi:hypothetical protein
MLSPQFTMDRESELSADQLQTLVERILSRVEFDTNGLGCWLWPGACVSFGYGRIAIANFSPFVVPRIIYTALVGPIPFGLLVLHTCDVGACFRPDHLFCGTHKENTQDCIAKGRFGSDFDFSGECNPNAKLTRAEAMMLRDLCAAGLSYAAASRRFDVSRQHARRIARGENFA